MSADEQGASEISENRAIQICATLCHVVHVLPRFAKLASLLCHDVAKL